MYALLATLLAAGAAPLVEAPVGRSTAAAVAIVHADAKRLRALDVALQERHNKAKAQRSEYDSPLPDYKSPLPYLRYWWFPNPPSEAELDKLLLGLKLHLNKLSTESEIMTPALIGRNVLRYDVRDLGWTAHQIVVYERFAKADPYFHKKLIYFEDGVKFDECWPGGIPDGKTEDYERRHYPKESYKGQEVYAPAPWLPPDLIDDLRHWLYTECPILNGEHFFINTVRHENIFGDKDTGYYEWFGPKGVKNRADYFALIGLDEAKSIKGQKEWRAAIGGRESGISNNGRQLLALKGVNGSVYGTLDVFSERDKSLVRARLRRGELAHDAERWFAFLNNYLDVTALFNAKGIIQAKAPPEVGGDRSDLNHGNDLAVHTNLSCWRCHGPDKDLLKPFKDSIRELFLQGKNRQLVDIDFDTQKELRRQYLSDFYGLIKEDQARYAAAVAACTASAKNPKGLTVAQAAQIYCGLWNRLVEKDEGTKKSPVTLDVAAREIGCRPAELLKKLEVYRGFRGVGDFILTVLEDGKGMSREEWESRYAFAAGLMLGQAFPEKLTKEKKGK